MLCEPGVVPLAIFCGLLVFLDTGIYAAGCLPNIDRFGVTRAGKFIDPFFISFRGVRLVPQTEDVFQFSTCCEVCEASVSGEDPFHLMGDPRHKGDDGVRLTGVIGVFFEREDVEQIVRDVGRQIGLLLLTSLLRMTFSWT